MEQTNNPMSSVSTLDVRKPKFYISDIIRLAWQKVTQNIWFFVGVTIIVLIIVAFSEIFWAIVEELKIDVPFFLFLIIGVLSLVLPMVVKLGFTKIALAAVDGRQSKILDLFDVMSVFFQYILAAILYMLIIFGGLILFIVPGIIWGLKYSLFPYYIIEGSSPLEAIKKSGVATHGSKINIFLLSLVLGLINLAGALLIGVGLLVTIPIQAVSMAYVYRALQPLSINKEVV
jgi:hypothetical protein